ncbi:MAG: methyltransferase domain-containing protein [Gemmatimonadota bacterium]|nr:methyltransferase domain-containing protein [Gemmatimonadota bacterium]
MDSPSLDRVRHVEALSALARVNAVSLSARRVWAEITRLRRRGVEPVRVLDVACGGGDVLHGLARRARKTGTRVELHGCDVSPVALDRARRPGADGLDVTYHQIDVLQDSIPAGFDVVCSSLFLHHLTGEAAVRLLGAMAAATLRVLIVQDLLRTRLGYVYARVGLGVLTRSDVARHDGLVSVASAFTLDEAKALCRDAGLSDAELVRCWPQRFTLRWERVWHGEMC